MSLLFGDNLQSRLSDIRAFNKIKPLFLNDVTKGKQAASRITKILSLITSDNRQRRGQNFCLKAASAVPDKIIPPVEDKLTEEGKPGESVAVTTADESIFETLQISNLAENMPKVMNYFTLKTVGQAG